MSATAVSGIVNHGDVVDEFLETCRGSPDPSSVRILIQRALSHPDLYCGFDELLVVPAVRELCQNDPVTRRTLELFSYGTVGEYHANRAHYLTLTPTQLAKLRRLTVVSTLGSSSDDRVEYAALRTALAAPTEELDVRALEDVLISCIYADLVVGRLDQRRQAFVRTRPAPLCRDVSPRDLPDLLRRLEAWGRDAASSTLQACDRATRQTTVKHDDEQQLWADVRSKVEEVRNDGGGNAHHPTRGPETDTAVSSFSSGGRGGGGGNNNWRGGRGGRGGGGRKWGKLG